MLSFSLLCEMDGFRFGIEDDWESDSGMDEGGARPEFTSGGGGDGDALDGRCKIVELGVRNSGELDRGELSEDGVRSGGEFDGEESSEDGVKGGGDLDGSGGDGSRGGSISIDFNLESVA